FACYANRMLANALAHMPSDSVVCAEAYRSPDGFHFRVSVRSSARKFDAFTTIVPSETCQGNRLWQTPAIDQVIEQLSEQLCEWRRGRFLADAG
ncbi:MAG: hypothetical protein AAB250_11515, partial [Bdellovibrionota bacterium]